jgi:hypothetical protein
MTGQVILLPTASRPVRLSVEPPLEQVTDFTFLRVTITFFLLHVGCPLWREDGSLIFSAITQAQVKLYCDRRSVGQFVLVSDPLWNRWPDFTFLWVTVTFFLLHVGRPLWREDGSVICSAITQVQVKLYCYRWSVDQFVLMSDSLWGPWPDFNYLYLTITFILLHVGRPGPYPPWTGLSSPKSKLKVKITLV